MADLHDLLLRTSRTFAISIPRLPQPIREEVTVAYLLFRVADTLEDAHRWSREKRLEALATFTGLLRSEHLQQPPSVAQIAAGWLVHPPCEHPGYLDLLRALPELLAALDFLAPKARATVLRHTLRTVEGMAAFTARSTADGALKLSDLEELRAYCYLVAGIVGEMLTELFLDEEDLTPVAEELRGGARAFGEALQLINILKDAADDARHGRVWLPAGVPRQEILSLARIDLDQATAYVRALQRAGAHRGVVAFTALPVLLARATLGQVERLGPGAKVPRSEVLGLVMGLEDALQKGKAAV